MKFPLEPQRTIFHEGIDAYELIKLNNASKIKFMCFCAHQMLSMISEEERNNKLVHDAISHIEVAESYAAGVITLGQCYKKFKATHFNYEYINTEYKPTRMLCVLVTEIMCAIDLIQNAPYKIEDKIEQEFAPGKSTELRCSYCAHNCSYWTIGVAVETDKTAPMEHAKRIISEQKDIYEELLNADAFFDKIFLLSELEGKQ